MSREERLQELQQRLNTRRRSWQASHNNVHQHQAEVLARARSNERKRKQTALAALEAERDRVGGVVARLEQRRESLKSANEQRQAVFRRRWEAKEAERRARAEAAERDSIQKCNEAAAHQQEMMKERARAMHESFNSASRVRERAEEVSTARRRTFEENIKIEEMRAAAVLGSTKSVVVERKVSNAAREARIRKQVAEAEAQRSARAEAWREDFETAVAIGDVQHQHNLSLRTEAFHP